jgi:repressor LexA
MAGKELTEKQKQIFDYITDYAKDYGFPPTREEIADHCGMKYKSGIVNHLQALERKGFIRLLKKVARGIEILKPFDFNIPIVCEIAAGAGLLAEENITEWWNPISNKELPNKTFAFRVRGKSMLEAGIFPNDIVFVDPATKPKDGDIGVILVDGEAVVKYVYYGDGILTLESGNRIEKRTVETSNSSLIILGTVIAIWRHMKLRHNNQIKEIT